MARFTMNKFCDVRIRGFLATAKQTRPLPNAPMNINTAYTIINVTNIGVSNA